MPETNAFTVNKGLAWREQEHLSYICHGNNEKKLITQFQNHVSKDSGHFNSFYMVQFLKYLFTF